MKKKNENKENNVFKKSLISSLLFIFLVIVVFYFIFKENNYKEVQKILFDAKKGFLLIAILCMSSFSLCEAFILRTSLKTLGNKISFRDAYKYAISGFFVASITPSATGGDPMQLYLMTKDNIKVSHGALTLLVKLLGFQFTSLFFAFIGFLFSHKLYLSSLGNLKYLAFLGIFLNILVFTLYFLIIFFKPVILFLVELVANLLKNLHIKKTDDIKENLLKQVEEYSNAAGYLKQNKQIFFKVFGFTVIEILLYYSIPYFVYLSLGFSKASIFTFLSLQSVLYVSVSSLPFPGAVGVSEVAFMRVYKTMFPSEVLGSAMVITRFINFYIFVLYAGIMMVFFVLKDNLKLERGRNGYFKRNS